MILDTCIIINVYILAAMNVILLRGIIEYIEYIENKKQGVRVPHPVKARTTPPL